MNTSWTIVPFEELSVRDLHAVLKLRVDVFVVEQTCPYAEVDGQDPQATHVLGKDDAGTLIAYATAPGKVAQDGDGTNSTYTAALLKALGEPGLPVEPVFKRVRAEVARVTGDNQVPWEASSLTGDFYFAIPAVQAQAPVAAKPAPAAADTEAELLFWQSVKDSQDIADFEAYLRQFPGGRFADIARNRLKRLSGTK